MKHTDLAWEEIKTEHLIQDEWIDFRRSAYRYPDGRVFEPFYSYSRRDYTVIVASDEEGKFLCVRQFRQGIKEVTTEFPAGGIERSDGKEYGERKNAEAALECAKRELMEETGYHSDEWTHLITIPSNATIADNYAYVFMAKNCRKTGEQHLDETECLNVEKHTADEIEELIRSGKFQQAVHVCAWLLAKERTQGDGSSVFFQNTEEPSPCVLNRYEKNRSDIARSFFSGEDPGEIAEVKETGDRHLRGESVTRIETEKGFVLYYKPRDCRSTELCGDLAELLFGERMVPDQITGEGFAFQKEVRSRIPQTVEEKAVYYEKMGRLTAMFYGLGSTDMHNGNVVCSADGPVVLDTETLLCAKAEGIYGTGEFSVDYGEIFPDLQTSVGECMVLPRFYGFRQTSPLVLSENDLIENCEKNFTAGFRAGYRLIRKKSEAVLRLLEKYRNAPFRYLLRSTQSYAARIWLYAQAKEENEREEILKKLAKGLSVEEKKRFAPVLEWEGQGIREGIIPYFCLYAGRKGLYGDAFSEPLFRDYLELTPIECARRRIARFGEEDLEVQCAYIRASLKHVDGWKIPRRDVETEEGSGNSDTAIDRNRRRKPEVETAGKECPDPETGIFEKKRGEPEKDAVEETLTAAEAIKEVEIVLQKLEEERIPLRNNCALWHPPMIKGKVGSWFGLAEGFAGISVFVHACARSSFITGRASEIARKLSRECFSTMAAFGEYLLKYYKEVPDEQMISRRFNGGFDFTDGLSGLLWALAKCRDEDPEREERIRVSFQQWGLLQKPKQNPPLQVILEEADQTADAPLRLACYGKADCLFAGAAGKAAALILQKDPDSLKEAGRILQRIRQNRRRNGCYKVFPGNRRSYFLPAFLYGSTGIAYTMLCYTESII